ncbi:MAG: phosphate acetyltransferase, partial [Brevinema sp.]
IKGIAQDHDIDLHQIQIVNYKTDPRLKDYAHEYYELRKHKGLSEEKALEEMTDDVFFGAKLMEHGLADAMVSGSISQTSKTLRAAIFFAKPKVKTLSGIFLMDIPASMYGDKGRLIFGDCAVVPNPTAEQLADIAIGCAEGARTLLNMDPKVALLSFSTKGSANAPETQKVVDAVRILKERNVDFEFDGEMQLDAAIDEVTAALKAPGSPVGGSANVLVFPELNTGNIGYKMVQRFARAEAYGPILQGLTLPINDLSRGCYVDDIVVVSAITMVQSF